MLRLLRLIFFALLAISAFLPTLAWLNSRHGADMVTQELGNGGSSSLFVLKTPAAPWDSKEYPLSPTIRRFTVMDVASDCRHRGIVILSENPWSEVSVEEPASIEGQSKVWRGGKKGGNKRTLQGCAGKRLSPVRQTAAVHGCDIAVTAGFFNTTDGRCEGNVVTKGTISQKIDTMNTPQAAHFGIMKNGSLFIGYPQYSSIDSFRELVGGALWIIRNGKPNWERSMSIEHHSVQQTGTWDRFVNIRSGRTAVGWDERGRIIVVAIDGRTDIDGATIPGIARTMMYFGAIEAVNLDGGGSLTVVEDGVVINSPSDIDNHGKPEAASNWINMNAERPVSTILCFKRTKSNDRHCKSCR